MWKFSSISNLLFSSIGYDVIIHMGSFIHMVQFHPYCQVQLSSMIHPCVYFHLFHPNFPCYHFVLENFNVSFISFNRSSFVSMLWIPSTWSTLIWSNFHPLVKFHSYDNILHSVLLNFLHLV
jgi:hypothetical protein